ncbi:mitotic checkpoint regulator, MAD2B-interacting-domain-containing protein [Annulohypoxylon moriforme]|nr:mitotic checkpoint regulator, MAD2B-interacting-domain-containing protein [Annulohypoxylon moriforme]
MGLVDYSDSESDSEPVVQPAPAPEASSQPASASGKRPFQKVVDRAKPGKILVNLPQNASGRDEGKPADGSDAPPAKRAKIGGRGGGAFSGFNSFLPPPKNVGKKPGVASGSGSNSNNGKSVPKPGVNLKTGAAPGFSREANEDGEGGVDATVSRNEDSEPPAKQPSIPAEQKPAEEVKLVGKPLMFRPLSVSRKPNKKGTLGKSSTTPKATATPKADGASPAPAPATVPKEPSPPPKKREKISLFSISDEQTTQETSDAPSSYPSTYEPMFATTEPTPADEFAAYDAQNATYTSTQPPPSSSFTPSTTNTSDQTLDALASSMNLSAAARRELFGRNGTASSIPASRVVNFDTDREYAHNEALRAAGQLQPAYNPIRAIAPGKHNLRQLVNQVQSQREALEESFATGKGKRNEAGAQYGWR